MPLRSDHADANDPDLPDQMPGGPASVRPLTRSDVVGLIALVLFAAMFWFGVYLWLAD